MRPTTLSLLTAFAVTTVTAVPEPALADTPARVDLTWLAPEGCPDGAAVVAEVDRLLRGSAAKDPVVARADVTQEGTWRVRLTTRSTDRAGRREVEADTCGQLADATALILALMIDPEAAMVASSPAPATPPPEAPRPHDALPAPRPREALPPPRPREALPPPRRWRVALTTSVLGDAGTMPAPSLGVGIGAGALVGDYRVAADLGYFPARAARLAAEPTFGGDLALLSGALRGCRAVISARFARAEMCVGAEIEAMHGSGFGVRAPSSGTSVWGALLAGGLVQVPILGPVSAELRVTAVVPFARPEFAFDDLGPVHRAAAAGARLAVGAAAHF